MKEATQTRALEDKRHGHVQDMRVHIRGDVSDPSKHALVTHVCPHSAARWVAFDLVLAYVSYGACGELKRCPLDGTSELKNSLSVTISQSVISYTANPLLVLGKLKLISVDLGSKVGYILNRTSIRCRAMIHTSIHTPIHTYRQFRVVS